MTSARIEFSAQEFNDFATIVEEQKIDDEKEPDAAVRKYLKEVVLFNPIEATTNLDPLQKLAAMVRAGGDSPLAHKIAGLVLKSLYIHEARSAEDIATFYIAAPHHHHHHAPEAGGHKATQTLSSGEKETASVDVGEVKKEMVRKGLSVSQSFMEAMRVPGMFLLGAGAAILTFGGPALLGLFVNSPAALAIGVMAAMFAAIALVGFAVSSGVILWQRNYLNSAMARAHTPEAVAKIFFDIKPETQVFLFDRLGSDFRKVVLETGRNNGEFLREFRGLFDVLNGVEASLALKKEAFERVALSRKGSICYDPRYRPFIEYVQTHYRDVMR
jgi:hypothetical protein